MVQERERRLGRGGAAGVVGHGDPARHRRDVGLVGGVGEHADDAGGALVGARLEVEGVREVGVLGVDPDGQRARVRHVGQERAEAEHHARVDLVGQGNELDDEGAPPHRRLDPLDEQHVATGDGLRRVQHAGRRPRDPTDAVDRTDPGPVDPEVVVLLGVDRGDRLGIPQEREVLDDARGGLTRVVPPLERRDDDGIDELGQVLDLDHDEAPAASGSCVWLIAPPYAVGRDGR